ncbi:PEP-CTERM sorting domain-containing protein [Glacieibacterium megasporae]|uniref:PEP-CTERM sorting domain-containing protein n=1 Tax=Glacieibacterium megasporae TaxID=2835787 RepID=UPI001C1DE57E|nr:PEP-CTERM sorting domain-containing protein [Polymorphobacter megasporae]UAJ10667.1 PEP-CTERM sorting domain-containing protein [Polymorphobacter megasporae]
MTRWTIGRLVCLTLLTGGGTFARATITDVTFSGHGIVTYNLSGTYLGNPNYLANIAVGDLVTVGGALHFGTNVFEGGPIAPIPDHYTGTAAFDTDALFDGQQSFDFSVNGPVGTDGFSFDSTSAPRGGPYKSGTASFISGRLVAFNLFADDDGFSGGLSSLGFVNYRGDEEAASFGGTVVLDSAAAPVPEPATWSLLVVGACATGLALRRRNRLRIRSSAGRSC